MYTKIPPQPEKNMFCFPLKSLMKWGPDHRLPLYINAQLLAFLSPQYISVNILNIALSMLYVNLDMTHCSRSSSFIR